MSRKLSTLAVACVLAACATGAMPITEADRAAIADLREEFRQAVLANDGAAVAAVYSSDAVEMAPYMPLVRGASAIEERNSAPMTVTEFTITPIETEGIGTMAYEIGTFTFTGMPEGMPTAIADTGKYTVVLEKQADGAWKFAGAIWNSDLPLPAPSEMQ